MLTIPLFIMPINKQVHSYSGILYSYVKEWGVSMYVLIWKDLQVKKTSAEQNKCQSRTPFV